MAGQHTYECMTGTRGFSQRCDQVHHHDDMYQTEIVQPDWLRQSHVLFRLAGGPATSAVRRGTGAEDMAYMQAYPAGHPTSLTLCPCDLCKARLA